MSLYSTAAQTAIIDPVFMSSRRCTFSLSMTDQAFLPNLRIGNLGLKADTHVEYALGCGVASCIRRITLLDGEEELDSLREVNSWLTFKSLFRPNAEAAYVKIPLEGGAGRGFTSSTTMETVVPAPFRKYTGTAAAVALNSHIHSGTLDLRDVFPILGVMTHLSTQTFKNLRVVIEWETDQQRMVVASDQSAVPLTPIMLADEITDQALIATLDKQIMAQPLAYDAIEVDQIGLKAIDGTAADTDKSLKTQSIGLQSAGFHGKYIKRMMIKKSVQDKAKNLSGTDVLGFGANASLAMNKEKVNLRVNGRSLLGGQGYTSEAQMAMGVADSWGEINAPAFANVQCVGLDGPRVQAKNGPAGLAPTKPSILAVGATDAKHSATTGQLAYCGFRLDSRADNLIIEYERSGRYEDPSKNNQGGTSGALDLTCFAEVAKSIQIMGGGEWRIQYM